MLRRYYGDLLNSDLPNLEESGKDELCIIFAHLHNFLSKEKGVTNVVILHEKSTATLITPQRN